MRKHTDEHRKNLSASIKAGYSNGRVPWDKGKERPEFSKEWREKLSKSLVGNTRRRGKKSSEETKKRISQSLVGRVHSEETKRKIGLAHKGIPLYGQRGKNSPHWRGGVTPINVAIRTSLEYKLWRESVFKRDNYTCIWCGNKESGSLNADHIKPFAYYPELCFAIDNGRTLCVPCHKTTDTYGSKAKQKYDNI